MYNDTRCWLSASHDVVVYFNISRGVVFFEAHNFFSDACGVFAALFDWSLKRTFYSNIPHGSVFVFFVRTSGTLFQVDFSVVYYCNAHQTITEVFLKCEMDSYYIDDQAQHIDNNRYAVHQEERTVFRKQMFDMVYKKQDSKMQ